jgi:hypothetical protein
MSDMKIIKVFTSLGIIAAFALARPVFAEESEPAAPLFFRAVNAGYKDDNSAQNYDFFELAKVVSDDLDLSSFKIQYYNSSDNLAGELEFAEPTILRGDSVVFGFNKSPQYQDATARYLYNFGSSGLASTAGRLRIIRGEKVVDEICWGKPTCEQQLPKFATKQSDNRTAVICHTNCSELFTLKEYYPEIKPDAIFIPEPEPVIAPSCSGLKITEIYSYYEESSAEQFIELYNSNDYDQELSVCTLRYKNKNYPLTGTLTANSYTIIQDILLTKEPSSSLAVELLDGNGVVDSLTYSDGQKRGASFAIIDGQ